jgi:hypothetical protein
MDRSNELRKVATECLALARTATDARTRMSLLSMAQKLLELESLSAFTQSFDAIVKEFNDQQMSKH